MKKRNRMEDLDGEDDPRIFFLHIPKAAGTTFKELLYKAYAFREIAWIDGKHTDEAIDKLKCLDPKRRERFRCVMGHFSYGLHRLFEGDYRYITFLREPVDRVVSFYYHVRHNSPDHYLRKQMDVDSMSIEEFAMHPMNTEARNCQVAMMSGKENPNESALEEAKAHIEREFAFVGLTEEFDLSLLEAREMLPFLKDIRYEKKNVNVAATDNAKIAVDRRAIEAVNPLDVEFYQFVKDRFWKRQESRASARDRELTELRRECAILRARRERFGWIYRQLRRLLARYRRAVNPLWVRD